MSPANYEGYYGEPPVVSPSRDQGMEGFPRPCSHKMLPKHNMTFPAHMNYVLIIQHFIKNHVFYSCNRKHKDYIERKKKTKGKQGQSSPAVNKRKKTHTAYIQQTTRNKEKQQPLNIKNKTPRLKIKLHPSPDRYLGTSQLVKST